MAHGARKPRGGESFGVFCLENWGAKLTESSTVRPILELLEQQAKVSFIHRHVRSVDETLGYLEQWSRGYEKYKLGYLACHGSDGQIWIGSERLALDDFGDRLAERGVSLEGRTIYLGACAALQDASAVRRRFLERTGADAICGYSLEEVYWLPSAAFEILLIDLLSEARRASEGLQALARDYSQLARELGFVYSPRPNSRAKKR